MTTCDFYTTARFWSKVSVSDIPDECWLWRAARSDEGYGAFRINGENALAHRLAYILIEGDIPQGALILHSCDVRHCCNPAHLRPGTAQENTDDMYARSRQNPPSLPGSRNGAAKLTEAQVALILNDPRSQRAIAAEYRVSQMAVWQIKAGKKWASVSRAKGVTP